jgi:hypothetical protein
MKLVQELWKDESDGIHFLSCRTGRRFGLRLLDRLFYVRFSPYLKAIK